MQLIWWTGQRAIASRHRDLNSITVVSFYVIKKAKFKLPFQKLLVLRNFSYKPSRIPENYKQKIKKLFRFKDIFEILLRIAQTNERTARQMAKFWFTFHIYINQQVQPFSVTGVKIVCSFCRSKWVNTRVNIKTNFQSRLRGKSLWKSLEQVGRKLRK